MYCLLPTPKPIPFAIDGSKSNTFDTALWAYFLHFALPGPGSRGKGRDDVRLPRLRASLHWRTAGRVSLARSQAGNIWRASGFPIRLSAPLCARRDDAMTREFLSRRNAHTRMHSDTPHQCVRCRSSTLCHAGARQLSDGHQPDNAKQHDADIHHANRHCADYYHHSVWLRARVLGANLRLRATGYPGGAGCGEAPDCGA